MNAARIATAAAVLAAVAAVPAASRTPAVAPAAASVTAPDEVRVAEPVAPVTRVRAAAPASSRRAVARRATAPKPAARETAARVRWDGRAFATPEAAMGFLVAAYNAHADRELARLTTPDARRNLVAMRGYAPALRLTGCVRLVSGAYDCEFTHSVAKTGAWDGYASFRVAPATRPGWYMTVLTECGDGEETA